MSDAIDRAAQVIAASDAAERGYDLDTSDVAIGHTIAMSLDAAGLLARPEHDAAVAARAWDEGHTAGVRNASAEWDGPVQDNPHEREGGAS